MNTPSLGAGALLQRIASAFVQPQGEATAQGETFMLPEAMQATLGQRLQTVADDIDAPASAKKQVKHASQDETVSPSLEILMTLLLTPERPVAAEKMAQAARPEWHGRAVMPLQIAQSTLPVEMITATPKQQAEQIHLAAQNLPTIAALGGQTETFRPPRPAAARHMPGEKTLQERTGTTLMASHHPLITEDVQISQIKMQPERIVSVDTRAAQWGEALITTLKENIHFQLGQQQQISTIRLDPPSLGKLEIAIRLDGGKLTVHIGASQPEIFRTLQQSGDALRLQLTQQNFVQVEVQVSPDGQSQSHSQQHGEQQSPTQIVSAIDLEADEPDSPEREDLLIKV